MAACILKMDLVLPLNLLKYVHFWPKLNFAVLYHVISVKGFKRDPVFAKVKLARKN